ncbi:MAG TPA: hypothetical protein VFF69_07865 [Phycisphaerales bacterium]|nr:hypothetical protein [Phycisphaerales bacterium]
MRLLGLVLIWVSLGVGVVAATTAYVWVVPAEGGAERFQVGGTPGQEPEYAVLAAPAGEAEDGGPIAAAGDALTPEVVTRLREAGVRRVRVKTFELSRWTHFPQFMGAAVGLLAGAILARLSTARAARLAEQRPAAPDALSPEAAVRGLRSAARALVEETAQFGDEEACRAVVERLGAALQDLAPVVLDSRERLVAKMGLGRYAGFMDSFAAGERSLNRAWSAAADLAREESIECLGRAGERLAIAEDRLTGRAPPLLPLA